MATLLENGSCKSEPQITDSRSDINNLSTVIDVLKPLESQWHTLGIHLQIKKEKLDSIEADHKQNGVQRCLLQMISLWQTNNAPSWTKLADAVKKVDGHNDVVKSIRKLNHGSVSSLKAEESESGYCSSHSGPDSDQDVLKTSSLSPGCGCGECNLHKMCTEGCPDPDHSKQLPILTKYNGRATASESAAQASEVTPQGKQNSVEVFEKETLDLRKHYGSLVTDTSESLGKREKKDRVALYLLSSFPILKIVAEEMKKATNMYRLLTAVTCQACSWFNFDIIKGLIEKFGSTEDHTRLKEYEQHFQRFAKQRLPQGMTHIELGSKHGINGCKQLVIKVDREWESVTVGELECLCIEFAKTLGVERKSVYLTDVNEGCIMLTMMIPEEIAEDLSKRKLTIEQKNRLEREKVVRLTCGKMKWSNTLPQSQQSFSDSEENEQEKVSSQISVGKSYSSDTPTHLENKTWVVVTRSIIPRSVHQVSKFRTDSHYEVKSFLYRLSLKLTKEQSNALVIIYELPAAMRDQSPFDVIMQLEMQKKYTTLEELAGMLKSICRDDLAKEVTTFAKKDKILKKNASPELFRPPHYDAQRNLECSLQLTKLQFTILQEQMKKLQEAAAIEPKHKRIEQRARNELKSASDKTFKELQYISALVALQTQTALGKRSKSWSASDYRQLEQTAGNDFKNVNNQMSNQLDTQSARKFQSIYIDDDGDSGFTEASQFIKMEPTQKPTLPSSESETHKQTAGYRWLTMSTYRPRAHVGYYKTRARHKVTLPESKDGDNDDRYTSSESDEDVDTNTAGTGDSGFVDASQFLKKEEPTPTLPPDEIEPNKLKAAAGYRRLTMSTQHPHVGYYKTSIGTHLSRTGAKK